MTVGPAPGRAGFAAKLAAFNTSTSTSTTTKEPLAYPPPRRPWTIIDPEALIVVSLAFGEGEARLIDLVAAWAGAGSFLVSKPRFKSIAALFPPDVEARVGDFVRTATEEMVLAGLIREIEGRP